MSYIYVKSQDLRSIVHKQEEIVRRLSEAESELRKISWKLQFNTTLSKNVSGQLRTSLAAITDERQALNSIRRALNDIASIYERTEQSVLKSGGKDKGIRDRLRDVSELLSLAAASLGMIRCGAFSADPVNLNTGNYVYEKTFLTIDALMPLSFHVFYNVQGRFTGVLGRGWLHSYEINVRPRDDGGVALLYEDGCEKVYLRTEDGTFMPSPGVFGSLLFMNGQYLATEPDGLQRIFDTEGRLLMERDRNGNSITTEYDDRGRLLSVIGSQGDFLNFAYNDEGVLTSVSDSVGRVLDITIEYDLVTAVGSEELGFTRYTYDVDDRLCTITSPRGLCSLENSYDESSRTIAQTFPDGGRASYAYNDDDGSTILREQNGCEIKYIRDERNRNVATVYSNGEESYAYNDDDLPVRFTDRLGRVTAFAYDAQGNLTRTENPKGDSFDVSYGPFSLPTELLVNGKQLYKAEYDERGNQTAMVDALLRKTALEYDERGCVTTLIQADGSAYTLEYDGRGDLVSVLTPFGGREFYEYDAAHRVIRSTDGCGAVTAYAYNDRGDITQVTDPAGAVCSYDYDACGNLTRFTDFNDAVTEIEYNELNLPCLITDPNGHVTRLEYDEMWQLIRRTDPDGGVTSYEYDDLHRVVKFTDPEGREVLYTHDAVGNVLSRTDPDGGIYETEYDELDRPVRIKDPSGAVTEAEYTVLSEIAAITDAAGNRFTREFDDMGQIIAETSPEVGSLRYTYNALGLLETVADSTGVRQRRFYLPGGLLAREEQIGGETETYEYDPRGNVIRIVNSAGCGWNFTYDCLGRIAEAMSDLGIRENYEYDAVGNLTAKTDGTGARTEYTYSLTGKLIGMKDADGVFTRYTYDAMDRLEAIIQPGGESVDINALDALNSRQRGLRVTSCRRDLMGNILSVTDAMGGEARYTYGKNGLLRSLEDADGNLTTFDYNPDKTRRSILYANGESVKFSYNALKQLTELEDWLGVTHMERDALGRITELTDPNGEKLLYSWGEHDELLSLRRSDGKATTYNYDERQRLVSCDADGRETRYSYFPNGLLREKVLPGGLSAGFGYDGMGRLTSLISRDENGCLDELNYSYDAANRRTGLNRRSRSGENGDFAYSYTRPGCLASVSKDGALLRSYEYDAFGNRTSMSGEKGVTNYSYNALDQLTAFSGPDGGSTFSYDRRGNMTREVPSAGPTLELTYNARSRLSSAVRGERRGEYTTNAFGQRTASRLSDASSLLSDVTYLRDPLSPFNNLLRRRENGVNADYFYGDSLLLEVTEGQARSFLTDDIGSPLRVMESGASSPFAYDEFGLPLAPNPPSPIGFAGYEPDAFTGLSFAHQRDYSPRTGRFISPDRIAGDIAVPLAINAYLYCRNDPFDLKDPSGDMVAWLAGGLVGAVKNVAVKFGGDLVNTVITGKPSFSSWESYVGTAAGGFVKGSVYVSTVAVLGPKGASAAAGAAGAATETFVSGGLEILTGKSDQSFGGLMKDTASSALKGAKTGFFFGAASDNVKIPGITTGQGNFDAVFRAGITKAIRYGSDISFGVVVKGMVSQGIGAFVGTITKKTKGWLKDKAMETGKTILRRTADYIKGRLSNRRGSAACPLDGGFSSLAA